MQNIQKDDGTRLMRVPAVVHEVIKEMAAVDRRTLGSELEVIVEAGLRSMGAESLAARLAQRSAA